MLVLVLVIVFPLLKSITTRSTSTITKLIGFHALDVSAELAQLFVEMLVAAIDVIDAAYLRPAFSLQPGQDQRG